eukprot:gb/GEZN01007489.1/.p1 GENE.gb/GEZN01007489.1/~~gb/GEZN01007489.1/.p1  ORF type:complete len:307 (+),score=42.74 gb/GEZN01007489.1/:51-971(+)
MTTHNNQEAARKTLGGILGGLCEATLLHPLDTIKTRLQLSGRKGNPVYKGIVDCTSTIIKTEGVTALYKGLTPFQVHLMTKYWLRFGVNFKLREVVSGGTGKTTFVQNLFCGMSAGTLEALLIVTPFEVVKTRLQGQRTLKPGEVGEVKYKNPIQTLGRIITREGPQGLWKGCAPTVFRQATNQASMFTAYTWLRANLWQGQEHLSPLQSFTTGVMAATVGPLVNCPADVIKTRLMVQTASTIDAEQRYHGFRHAYVKIWREEGFAALYKGIFPRLLRLAPGQGVTWVVVEKFGELCDENNWLTGK